MEQTFEVCLIGIASLESGPRVSSFIPRVWGRPPSRCLGPLSARGKGQHAKSLGNSKAFGLQGFRKDYIRFMSILVLWVNYFKINKLHILTDAQTENGMSGHDPVFVQWSKLGHSILHQGLVLSATSLKACHQSHASPALSNIEPRVMILL